MRGHKTGDRVDERFVRLRADQGIDRILCNADPGPEDEQRDEQPDVSVDLQSRQLPDDAREQDCARRDHVIAAVGGADPPTELPVEDGHPELDQNGTDQNDDDQRRKLHGLRMQDLADRAFDQLHADDQDQNRHGQARQVFHARMAVGMLVVGRAGGQLESNERHDRAGRVRQVVDGVRRDRYAPGDRPGQKLEREQQKIADDAGHAREPAVSGADRRVGSVRGMFYKEPQQKIRHDAPSFQ